jgi:hypothetical protein
MVEVMKRVILVVFPDCMYETLKFFYVKVESRYEFREYMKEALFHFLLIDIEGIKVLFS